MSKDTVNVEIGEDLVRPIVETKIQAAMKKQLSQGDSASQLASAVIEGMVGGLECKYTHSVKVSFNGNEQEDE